MLESILQKKIIDYYNKKWYITIKLIKTNLNWIPDLQILTWDWKSFFIEVKQKNWKQSEIQKYRQDQLIEKWYKSYCIYSFDEILELI